MPKVKANQITINYDQQGTGEPLILIPYLAADYACYAFQVAEYAKQFTCISIDLRGTGESDKPEGVYSTVRGRPVQPLATFLQESNAVIAHDVAAQLGQITVPTQITFGRHDVLTSTRFADRMTGAIRGSEVLIFEGCAHAPIYEKVEEFNQKEALRRDGS